MYNLAGRENLKIMGNHGKILRGVAIGVIIGVLSFIFLFSNHFQLALATTVIVSLIIAYMPENIERKKEPQTKSFIFPKDGDFVCNQVLPQNSLLELKPSTEEALFEGTFNKAITEAETGDTSHLIWHIDKNGETTKFAIHTKMPGEELDGPVVSLSHILDRLFS